LIKKKRKISLTYQKKKKKKEKKKKKKKKKKEKKERSISQKILIKKKKVYFSKHFRDTYGVFPIYNIRKEQERLKLLMVINSINTASSIFCVIIYPVDNLFYFFFFFSCRSSIFPLFSL
jgi:hypothetical protein